MSWFEALPQFFGGLAVLYLPGLLVLLPARLAPMRTFGLAPVISMFFLNCSAVVANLSGHAWWWLWVAVPVVVTAGLVELFTPKLRRTKQGQGEWSKANWAVLGHYSAGIAIAVLFSVGPYLRALVGPEAFAQVFDNAWHLNAIQLVASEGYGSAFSYSWLDSTSFYPAAWYDWIGLMMQLTHGPLLPSVQMCTVIVVLVLWPLSVCLLADALFPLAGPGRFVAGALSMASVSFPLGLLSWGLLFPNIFGFALAPAVIALGWKILGFGRQARPGVVGTFLLLAASAVSVLLAHPNALLASGSALVPPAVLAVVRKVRSLSRAHVSDPEDLTARTQRRSQWLGIWLIGVACIGFCALWAASSMSLGLRDWHVFSTYPQSIGELLLGSGLSRWPTAIIAIGLVNGLLMLLIRPGLRIVPLMYLAVGLPYVVSSSSNNVALRTVFSNPFYADPYRMAAAFCVMSVPIAVYGWNCLIAFAVRQTIHRGESKTRGCWKYAAFCLGFAIFLSWWQVLDRGTIEQFSRIKEVFTTDEKSQLLTSSEMALVQRIPEDTPEDAVIVTNPWDGGGMIYALADRRPTQPYMFGSIPDSVKLINRKLNRITTDPEVCSALKEQNATYVLSLESKYPTPLYQPQDYAGFNALTGNPAFEVVDSDGGSVLYKIKACQ